MINSWAPLEHNKRKNSFLTLVTCLSSISRVALTTIAFIAKSILTVFVKRAWILGTVILLNTER